MVFLYQFFSLYLLVFMYLLYILVHDSFLGKLYRCDYSCFLCLFNTFFLFAFTHFFLFLFFLPLISFLYRFFLFVHFCILYYFSSIRFLLFSYLHSFFFRFVYIVYIVYLVYLFTTNQTTIPCVKPKISTKMKNHTYIKLLNKKGGLNA